MKVYNKAIPLISYLFLALFLFEDGCGGTLQSSLFPWHDDIMTLQGFTSVSVNKGYKTLPEYSFGFEIVSQFSFQLT